MILLDHRGGQGRLGDLAAIRGDAAASRTGHSAAAPGVRPPSGPVATPQQQTTLRHLDRHR